MARISGLSSPFRKYYFAVWLPDVGVQRERILPAARLPRMAGARDLRQIRPAICAVTPIERAEEAHALLYARKGTGKIVLKVD